MGGGAQQLNLEHAASVLGVSLKALERRLRRGDLPEAQPLDGQQASLGDPPQTETELWALPASALPTIAAREGWVIDLRGEGEALVKVDGAHLGADTDVVEIEIQDETNDITIDLETDTVETDTDQPDDPAVDEPLVIESGSGLDEVLERLLTMSSDLTEAVVARERAERTVEAQRSEIDRVQTKIIENEAVIERQEAENVRLATDLNRALGDVRVAETLASERGARVDEARAEIDRQRSRNDDEIRRHRAQNAELRRRLEASTNAMGWWSKRRLRERPNK